MEEVSTYIIIFILFSTHYYILGRIIITIQSFGTNHPREYKQLFRINWCGADSGSSKFFILNIIVNENIYYLREKL